jgi:hypothetical protein
MSINDELLAELESELGQVLRIAEFAGGVDQLSAVGIGSYLRLVTPQKVLSLLASNRALLAHIVELKRDAERYRRYRMGMVDPDALDASIDAAMESSQ